MVTTTSMSVTVQAKELKSALAWVGKAAHKTNYSVVLNVSPDSVVVASTNGEVEASVFIPPCVQPTATWDIALPIGDLRKILSGAPAKEDVTISYAGSNQVEISYGIARFNLKGKASDNVWLFNALEDMEYCAMINLAAIAKVAVGRASDDTRPVLQCVHIDELGVYPAATAADGFRLATILLEAAASSLADVVGDAGLNIPDDIVRVLPAKGYATLSISSERVGARGCRSLMLALSDGRQIRGYEDGGNYPDYSRLIPTGYDAKVTLSTSEFIAAIKQLKPVAERGSSIVRLVYDDGKLAISTRAEEVSDAVVTLAATRDGAEAFHIALNHRYIAEALATIESETVSIGMTTPSAVAVFRGGDADPLWLIMPMFVQW